MKFVHTSSLEVRIWRGRRDDWPEAGSSCGVAKVALRSLLTTLGGIGGTVPIDPGQEHGSTTGGSIEIIMFFKHRGLGSNDASSSHNDGGTAGGHHAEEGGRGGVGVTENEGQLRGSHRSDGAALDGKSDTGVVGDANNTRTGSETVPPLAPSLLSFAGFSNPAVAFDPAPGQAVGNGASRSQAPDGSAAKRGEPAGGGKLKVYVERAMRLPPAASEVVVSGASAEALPSTYVTFRWEEGGKPPLRSPLDFETTTSGRKVDAPTNDWRVRVWGSHSWW